MVVYTCNLCSKSYTNKYDYNRHLSRKIPCRNNKNNLHKDNNNLQKDNENNFDVKSLFEMNINMANKINNMENTINSMCNIINTMQCYQPYF